MTLWPRGLGTKIARFDKVSDPALSGASAIATNSRCSRLGRMA
jgi:hypothetical protein